MSGIFGIIRLPGASVVDAELAEIELIKLSRLSVAVITPEEWDHIIAMSEA